MSDEDDVTITGKAFVGPIELYMTLEEMERRAIDVNAYMEKFIEEQKEFIRKREANRPICRDCGGSGYVRDGSICDPCRGHGRFDLSRFQMRSVDKQEVRAMVGEMVGVKYSTCGTARFVSALFHENTQGGLDGKKEAEDTATAQERATGGGQWEDLDAHRHRRKRA